MCEAAEWSPNLSAWVTNAKVAEKIKGLKYIQNYVSADLEREILSTINEHSWMQEILRRQQFYGKRYYHTTTDRANLQPTMDQENSAATFPIACFSGLVGLLVKDGIFPADSPPDQILVNEYVGRAGIGSHFDDSRAFGPVIVTVSLGSPIWMILKRPRHLTNTCPEVLDEVRIFLEPNSLFIMAEDVRYGWRHSINRSKMYLDPRGAGKEVERTVQDYCRISLTIRNVLDTRKRVAKDAEEWMSENLTGTDCIHNK